MNFCARIGQDRTGQDRTGQDRTGQDRTGDNCALRQLIQIYFQIKTSQSFKSFQNFSQKFFAFKLVRNLCAGLN